MNLQLKTWQKILLTLFCFGIAIVGFIIKLPSTFRGYDKELHSAFYFCAAVFLNILFAKRNIIIHAVIFGALYVFGILIEHGQVMSKQLWQIPHGRYDPEDVQGNLKGLLLFSAVWLVYIAIYYLTRQKEETAPVKANAATATEELVYEDKGEYFLLDYSPGNSEMIIRKINRQGSNSSFNIDLYFKAVHHIQLPTKMEDIKICKVPRKHIAFQNPYNREAIYRISDKNGNTAFIDAGVFVVFHNELDMLTSSLGDFTWSSSNREVFSDTIKGD